MNDLRLIVIYLNRDKCMWFVFYPNHIHLLSCRNKLEGLVGLKQSWDISRKYLREREGQEI